MNQIVVDQQQAEAIRASRRSIQVVDGAGNVVGFVKPAPPDAEINLVKARIAQGPGGPMHSSEQVFDRLRSLGKS